MQQTVERIEGKRVFVTELLFCGNANQVLADLLFLLLVFLREDGNLDVCK